MKQIVEAHRGASGYFYQNTIEAFDEAVRMKADAIELDIRKTKDEKIIVVHDPTYHDKHINDWLYDDLIKETQKDNFVMPLFIDVLKKYKGQILLDVEIKEEGYEEEILNMILSILDLSEFQIRSFSEFTVREIKRLNDKVFAILLIGAQYPKYGIFTRIGEIFPKAKIRRSKCDAVSPNYQLLILWYTKRMHMQKKLVFAWTVDDEKIIKRMFKIKADGVVTDYPDKALRIRESLK